VDTQDPDLIVSIFTPIATYHERMLQQPIIASLPEYWSSERLNT
jgi:hypothetical protein